ncbi:MAG: hypothetical protein R3B84_00665 [Zavarzinella sp.]
MCLKLNVRILALGILIMSGFGCDSANSLYPVAGAVFFEDQPAAGATVIFVPVDGDREDQARPTGKVDPSGNFTLTHPRGAGAIPGEYIVLVSWFDENARNTDQPKNKLPEKYADQSHQLLRATVQNKTNQLEPFRLTK